MQKVIALDIGSYSIKAVEVLNHFNSYKISNYYENIIPKIEQVPSNIIISNCLAQLFEENKINADRIVTAMPGQYISSRLIPFGFSDPNKIAPAVLAEIEDSVPFSLDDMIIDQQNIGSYDAKTLVLVVLTRKHFLRGFLDNLKNINIDPKVVDVDSLTLYNLCPYLNLEQDKCYGIVDFGHEKTSICLVQNNILKMFRSINLAGRYLTDFIAKDFQISFGDAERLKHRVSCLSAANSELSQEFGELEKKVVSSLTNASHSIVRELGRTLYAFKTWEKTPVEKIFISGGASVLKNLDAFLTQELEVEVQRTDIKATSLEVDEKLSEKTAILTQGVGIGLRAVNHISGQSQINLRRGEFAYTQDYTPILKLASALSKGIFILFVVSIGCYFAKYFVYKKEVETVESTYKKELYQLIPAVKKKVGKKNYSFLRIHKDTMKMFKKEGKNLNIVVDNFSKKLANPGALLALKDLSSSIDKKIKVEVVEFRYITQPDSSAKLKMRIEAESFDAVADFKGALSKNKNFSSVDEKSSESKPGSDLKVADFEINYRVLD